MITQRQWFTAKHGQRPTFTEQVKRQERHYGKPFPVKRSRAATIAAIRFFACFIMAGILLGVDAIPVVEVVR